MYERGEREPGIDKINILANFYKVSVDYLVSTYDYDVDPEGRLPSIPEDALLQLRKKYPGDPHRQWIEWWDMECDRLSREWGWLPPENLIPLPQTRPVPLLGTIACGEPILAEQNVEAYVNVNSDIAADFALKCKGDSMINARIFDGDIVYIRSQPDVDDGEIAAVLIDSEATLKRVRKLPNKLILSPCNPMYDDLIYTAEQLNSVRILGKAVAFTSIL